jgi:beta-N-acetylhexosaminidase
VAAVAVTLVLTAAAVPSVPPERAVVMASATAAPQGGAAAVLARMTLAQRVGQVFMVGGQASGVSAATKRAITRYHVGNAMLTGRSHRGITTTRRVARGLQGLATSATTARVPLFVATDQEGGTVQVLNGRGFADIPTASAQGTWSIPTLRKRSTAWASQLRSAGVNVNLGPVMDTVPSRRFARVNPPVGALFRHYGYTPSWVAGRGTAFALGMRAAGVEATIKHFPGLGRVTANTDTRAGVTDRVTTRHDSYVRPFAYAVSAGVPFVMMSSAYYTKIDRRHPAVFSRMAIEGMLRGDLGFTGVVISDDLANAKQVARWSPGARAVKFLAAGGDLVLTVDPVVLPAMYQAVLKRAAADSGFRARVEQAALRILLRKEARGLIARATTAAKATADGTGHHTGSGTGRLPARREQ